jgi:hypothetical protein
LPVSTVYYLAGRGEIPACRLGRTWRFLHGEVTVRRRRRTRTDAVRRAGIRKQLDAKLLEHRRFTAVAARACDSRVPTGAWSADRSTARQRLFDAALPSRTLRAVSVSVTLPDDLAARLAEEAARRHVTADELAATLLAKDLREPQGVPDRPLLRQLMGMGASDGKHSAADIEDFMVANGFGR